MKRKTLLKHIEEIDCGTGMKNGQLRLDPKVRNSHKIIKEFLGCSSEEAMLFAITFVLSFKRSDVEISDISAHLDCEIMEVLPFLPVMEKLEKQKIIRRDNGRYRRSRREFSIFNESFFVSRNVVEAVVNENKDRLNLKLESDMFGLLEMVDQYIEDRDDELISSQELINDIEHLLEANKELLFVRRARGLGLFMEDLILLLYVSYQTVCGNVYVDLTNACERIFDSVSQQFQVRKSMIRGKSDLISKNICKLEEGSFKNDRDIKLTAHALSLLFEDDLDIVRSSKTGKGIIEAEKIKREKLFFNRELQENYIIVKRSLKKRNFERLQKDLRLKNLNPGLTMLFYGPPGTGKTACCYLLAKETGRGVLPVDISSAKSMWYGESQKKVKSIFDDYRSLLEKSDVAPILLFNECDALLSTRKSKSGGSAVDQTENAIQNILLEEMEKFEGIMIATTNLSGNLDGAFERRFLYKLNFELPNMETRAKIWKHFFTWLTKEEAMKLANDFSLSGGIINNISKKIVMEELIMGKKPDCLKLEALCREETWKSSQAHRIGYRVD